MPGRCEFTDDSNDYLDYDYDYHYDYDFADEDKEQCFQSCLQKSRSVDDAAGCYFPKYDGQCIFLKTGTIIGGSGDSDIGTCWKFDEGNVLCSLIFLHNISNIQYNIIKVDRQIKATIFLLTSYYIR